MQLDINPTEGLLAGRAVKVPMCLFRAGGQRFLSEDLAYEKIHAVISFGFGFIHIALKFKNILET